MSAPKVLAVLARHKKAIGWTVAGVVVLALGFSLNSERTYTTFISTLTQTVLLAPVVWWLYKRKK